MQVEALVRKGAKASSKNVMARPHDLIKWPQSETVPQHTIARNAAVSGWSGYFRSSFRVVCAAFSIAADIRVSMRSILIRLERDLITLDLLTLDLLTLASSPLQPGAPRARQCRLSSHAWRSGPSRQRPHLAKARRGYKPREPQKRRKVRPRPVARALRLAKRIAALPRWKRSSA
jgi:hypothetical protein